MTHASRFTLIATLSVSSAIGAPVTTTGSDPVGSSSIITAGVWSNSSAPSSGNDYTIAAGHRVRTPANGTSYSFAGDSLTISDGGSAADVTGLSFKGTGTTATITINNLILDGGSINHINGTADVFNLDGSIHIASSSLVYARQGAINILAPISGSATVTNPGSDGAGRVLSFLSSSSTFSGNLVNNGRFTLADDAVFNFSIGAPGISNTISGTGAATIMNGDFVIDTSAATSDLNDQWNLVTASNVTYGATFSVEGWTETNPGQWWDPTNTWRFTPSDGILIVTNASDPNLISYVDANSGNTTRWDGQTFDTAAEGNITIDNNWEIRNLGNSGRIYEANADGPENAPLLVTTLTGLAPDTDYVIYAHFWHDGRNWRLKASADSADIDDNGTEGSLSDDFLPTHPLTNFASTSNAGGTATLAPAARATDFAASPLLTEGNRVLRQAPLGLATSDGAGNLAVYIDDLALVSEANRTWFDGVGYKLALPLEPLADEDGDGLTNGDEATAGTNAYIADTDGDTHSDGIEIAAGSDPLNPKSVPPLPGNALAIAPDGAWTWFNDERVIFHQGSLFSGYVKANGEYGVTRYDPATNTSHHMVISTNNSRQQDDHNNPSITVLPNDKLMILYAKHLGGAQFYQRTSLVDLPSTDADWGSEIINPLTDNNTYNNTYILSEESNRIYNFHRNINFNPTITYSDNLGADWTSVQFIEVGSNNIRPYPRYCSNHANRVDLIYTDGHPRDENNSVYHMYYEAGNFQKTDGALIDSFANLPLDHQGGQRGSVIYQYSNAPWGPEDGPDNWIPTGRGWTWDVHYGTDGNPVCVFQVQVDNVTGSGWNNDRIYYYYARWTGTEWKRKFIAQAGRPLYSAEDDYGGGMCIDPENPNVVYFSSNAANPFNLGDINNVPLAPDERYEIYRGVTEDGGETFTWKQITFNSPADNLRPVIPENHGYDRALVWFYGTYTSYLAWDTQVLAILENDLSLESALLSPPTNSGTLTWSSSPGRSYRIGATSDLIGFPHDAATGVVSEGGSTSHTFDFPSALTDSPRGYFVVEEE